MLWTKQDVSGLLEAIISKKLNTNCSTFEVHTLMNTATKSIPSMSIDQFTQKAYCHVFSGSSVAALHREVDFQESP